MPTDFFTGGGVTGVGVAISEVLGCHKHSSHTPPPTPVLPAPSGTQRPPREGTHGENAAGAAEPGNLFTVIRPRRVEKFTCSSSSGRWPK